MNKIVFIKKKLELRFKSKKKKLCQLTKNIFGQKKSANKEVKLRPYFQLKSWWQVEYISLIVTYLEFVYKSTSGINKLDE